MSYDDSQAMPTLISEVSKKKPKGALRGASLHTQYVDYEPFGACKKLFGIRVPELIISGPAGTGKSRGALEKSNWLLEKYPRIRGLMIRKTRRSMTQSCVVTFEQEVMPNPSYIPFHGGDQEYRYPNGSIFALAGLDDPLKIYSSQWDFVYVNQAEELMEEEWEQIKSRIRNYRMPYQQLLGDVNPGPPNHWIKVRASTGALTLLESRHEDNPIYWDQEKQDWTEKGRDYVLGTLESLTGVRKKRLRYGQWAAAEGTVYEESWDRSHHIIDRFVNAPLDKDQVPKDWRRIWVFDFGFKNPLCFDDSTEILSESGWTLFKNLPQEKAVATLNPVTHILEWQVPIDHIQYPYVGDLITTSSKQQSADFAVTPDHEMVVESRRSKKWSKVPAKSLPQGSSIPVGWEVKKVEDSSEIFEVPHNDPFPNQGHYPRKYLSRLTRGAFARFLGLLISDGNLHSSGNDRKSKYIRIFQSAKSTRINQVRSILKETGWDWGESENQDGVIHFCTCSADLFDFLKDHGLYVTSAFKRVPRFIFEWGTDSLQALLDGLMCGDGSYIERGGENNWVLHSQRYHTISSGLADDVQEIACRLGVPCKIHKGVRDPKRGYPSVRGNLPSTSYGYTVNFHTHDRACVEQLGLNKKHYDGNVFCVTVPNGIIIVRRNGRPMVSGNCWQAWAEDHDGRLFRYKELYKTGMIVEDAAKLILKVTADEPKPVAIICDHDLEDRATLERHLGMQTKAAWKYVSPGLQSVEARLRKDEQGKARIFWLRDSLIEVDKSLLAAKKPTCSEDEFEVYVWETSMNRRKGEEPKKEFDHGKDCERYVVAYVDELSKRTHNFFGMISVTKSGGVSASSGSGLSNQSSFRMATNAPRKFGH